MTILTVDFDQELIRSKEGKFKLTFIIAKQYVKQLVKNFLEKKGYLLTLNLKYHLKCMKSLAKVDVSFENDYSFANVNIVFSSI